MVLVKTFCSSECVKLYNYSEQLSSLFNVKYMHNPLILYFSLCIYSISCWHTGILLSLVYAPVDVAVMSIHKLEILVSIPTFIPSNY